MNQDGFNCFMYMIEQGDTLYSISRRYNIPLQLILRANPYADIYNLNTGDEICIPDMRSNGPIGIMPYVVQEGDSLGSILYESGIELNDVLNNNNPNEIMLLPGSTIYVPSYGEDM